MYLEMRIRKKEWLLAEGVSEKLYTGKRDRFLHCISSHGEREANTEKLKKEKFSFMLFLGWDTWEGIAQISHVAYFCVTPGGAITAHPVGKPSGSPHGLDYAADSCVNGFCLHSLQDVHILEVRTLGLEGWRN